MDKQNLHKIVDDLRKEYPVPKYSPPQSYTPSPKPTHTPPHSTYHSPYLSRTKKSITEKLSDAVDDAIETTVGGIKAAAPIVLYTSMILFGIGSCMSDHNSSQRNHSTSYKSQVRARNARNRQYNKKFDKKIDQSWNSAKSWYLKASKNWKRGF